MSAVGRNWLAALAMALAFGGASAQAQDLTAGRSPAQLFASGCSGCHKSPQGLAKGQSGGSLSGFLRQHYTSKPEMADALAGYLASAGGAPAPGGRAGRAAAQEPPGAPGAAAPGRARATIAVPLGGEPAAERGPPAAKRQPPAARPGAKPTPAEHAAVPTAPKPHPVAAPEAAKPADAPETAATPERSGAPSIITEEPGRAAGAGQAAAGQANAIRTSRKHRDAAGIGPDASGRADRVTNLHGAAGPAAPGVPSAAANAGAPGEPSRSEPPRSEPSKSDAAKSEPPKSEAPKTEPPRPAGETPTASIDPAAAAPAETPSKQTVGRPGKPNSEKDAAVAEEKSAVRSAPPVRMRAGPARAAGAGTASTARRPSSDSPN